MTLPLIAVLLCFSLLMAVGGCQSSAVPPSGNVELAKALREVESDQALLLDVREDDEWQAQHFIKARLAPSSKLRDEATRVATLQGISKEQKIYTHCKKGGRARQCADMLCKLGYHAQALEVPYETLKQAGFQEPVK